MTAAGTEVENATNATERRGIASTVEVAESTAKSTGTGSAKIGEIAPSPTRRTPMHRYRGPDPDRGRGRRNDAPNRTERRASIEAADGGSTAAAAA